MADILQTGYSIATAHFLAVSWWFHWMDSNAICFVHTNFKHWFLTFLSAGWVKGLALDPNQGWPLQWRHNEHDGVSNHQPYDCLLNHLFRRRSKKTSNLRATGLCEGNSPLTGEFPSQRASNTENVSIWWRHHDTVYWCSACNGSVNGFVPTLKHDEPVH